MTSATNVRYLSANRILGWQVRTVDGASAGVMSLLVDTDAWRVPFLGADAQAWAPDRQVLVNVAAIGGIDEPAGEIGIAMDARFLRSGPVLEAGKVPAEISARAAPPPGWEQQWRTAVAPENQQDPPAPPAPENTAVVSDGASEDAMIDSSHLVRWEELRDCRVETADGAQMRLMDLLIDDSDWSLAYLEVAFGPDSGRSGPARPRAAWFRLRRSTGGTAAGRYSTSPSGRTSCAARNWCLTRVRPARSAMCA
ncbi:MAG: hypothetical protein K9M02_03945 [Thiohalocapsa sp.]|nr:hypothetical protein [Thiohalocapsa sp.]